ncbi:MAG: RIP metalloprotease RseP [Silicimonas sp.]|nr:RIP metalloprotease RseP [Silicimonas sp.]
MDIAGLIPTFGNFFFTIAAFIIALSIIIAIHEYGHYIVGRWTGIKAEVFSIGFGPVLTSRVDKHGTRWQIAALPFGGYVKFLGDGGAASNPDEEVMAGLSEDERRHSMHGAPLWARAATVFAGPAFNFALSFLIFAALLLFRGVTADPVTIDELHPLPSSEVHELMIGDVLLAIDGKPVPNPEEFREFAETLTVAPELPYRVLRNGDEIEVTGPWPFPPMVQSTTPDSAADKADLQEGDVITAIDGQAIFDFDELRDAVGASDGKALTINVWRQGEGAQSLTLEPTRRDLPLPDGGFETRWLIGMTGGLVFKPAVTTPSIGEAATYGADQIVFIIRSSLSGLYHMIAGKISTCNLSGPIGIAEVSGQAASQGWFSFIWFIALLSTAVGMLNLFPIPVLDGGHLVFHAWEAVTGRPPSDRALRYLMAGGLTLMLGLMAFSVGNDLICP